LFIDYHYLSLSFISSFSNLQTIILLYLDNCDSFKELQYVAFPKLQTLKIPYYCPNPMHVIKFLEVNGKNLEEFYINENNNVLNLSIAKLCPNLKKLFVIFNDGEIDILRDIFNSCQYLERVKIFCGESHLNEKEVLEVVVKSSPKNFYELKIINNSDSILVPEDLESFFVSWQDRIPSKLFSLTTIKDGFFRSLEMDENNMKIIKKYKNLGIIKKFETKDLNEEVEEEIDIFFN